MIWIEDLMDDKNKICINCKRKKDDVKLLRFLFKDSYYKDLNLRLNICLCGECRAKLKEIL